MTTIQDMHAAVDTAAHAHFDWCTNHNYEDPEPNTQLCRSTFDLDFTAARDGDDITAISVELAGSHADVEYGREVPTASIGFNGGFGPHEIAPWKLTPIAYLLLAAQARAEGDQARARAFEDAANTAIAEHLADFTEPEPEHVVAEAPRHWSQGPFSYVMGSDPADGVITWDQYEVEQALAAGIPQWVVQHAEDGRRYRVVGALDSVPVDDATYGGFDEAKAVRDRLNGRARAEATARQFAAFDIDDEVKPLTGVFAGLVGVVDELDFADDDTPFRVRFEHVDGEPIAWFNADDLTPAGGAR